MRSVFLFACLFLTQLLAAQLRLPAFLSDDMVLQQQKINRLWGWAKAGDLVTVTFKEKTYTSLAADNGGWQVFLEASGPGNAGNISISTGTEKKLLKNILVGEVWVCSGQSNMEMKMGALEDLYKDELLSAANDHIRFVVIDRTLAGTPQDDVKLEKNWSAISPATIRDCSGVAYWYAKKLQKQLQVPVGLVITSWGGTPAEAWTSFEGLYDFPHYTKNFTEGARKLDLANIARVRQSFRDEFQSNLQKKYEWIQAAVKPGFDDAGWKTMALPAPWEQQGYPTLDGVVVYRIVFNIPAGDAGKAAQLNLPAVDDMDSTYINGVFIGSINRYDALRKYAIPAGVLKAGENLLSIRVQDDQGGGGLSNAADHFNVTVGGRVISLEGLAKYFVVAEIENFTAVAGDIEDQPTLLFNGMIAPLLPLSIRGAIWYQGESNADPGKDPFEYRTLFPAMIRDWRNRWGQGEFPFLFVQLSSFGAITTQPVESNWAVLRESQTKTLALPNTAMAVSIDVGNPTDIHPHQKKEVGERLADGAMKAAYGKTTSSSGPLLKNWKIRGNQVVLEFNDTGKGLTMKGNRLQHFAIAGADKKFVWANAVIKGNQVIVSSPLVLKPLAVRYAWANSPVNANLYNRNGYPAAPFRTDDWPVQ
jgi:sialate O-acetylesterase